MVFRREKTKISIDLEKLKPSRQGFEAYSVIFFSLILRIFNLGKESLWLDEVYSILYVTERYTTLGILFNLPLNEPHPPLHYLILNLWAKIFGKTEFAIRFPSAIFGTLAVASTYLLGKKLFNHYIGIFSALMMSLSSYHIYYSQSARMYSLLAFLGTLSLYYMICVIEDTQKAHYKKYVVTTVLLAYTHVFGLFVLIIENGYVFGLKISKWLKNDRDSLVFKSKPIELSSWLKTQSLIGVLISPWILIILYRTLGSGSGLSNISWMSLPQLGDLVEAMTSLLILKILELDKYGLTRFENTLNLFSISIVLIGLLSIFFNVKEDEINILPSKEALLAISMILTPLIGSFIISYIIVPLFNPRYLISGSVGLFLLLGYFLQNINNLNMPKNLNHYISLFFAGVILLTISVPLPTLYLDDQNEKWNEVSKDIESLSEPGELIMINAYMGKAYNYHRKESRLYLRELPRENPSSEVKELMKNRQKAWLILYQADEESYIEKISDRNMEVSNVKEYDEIKLYKISKPGLCLP